ncbi:MAG: hypothetical protein KJ731_10525 [Alphaproteobacteria bacterium]|nr:hypothetical protein [Alphaproteobacteria bacterium]MBU1280899.1 hypothetical protein [Alphaproteobacteria bacterium]MBU1574422.1 hypothetical protein [Alphaproteobacteria bacterium]MBU1828890.1 hypothetical protein [Alphaproteobacteria bacterium]MBU2079487.1 hypothetical protein [Alphaproteobacteria bacterium]
MAMVSNTPVKELILSLSWCLLLGACVDERASTSRFCDNMPEPTASIFLDDKPLNIVSFCEDTPHGQHYAVQATPPQSSSIVKIRLGGDYSENFPKTLMFDGKVYDGFRYYGEPETIAFPFAGLGDNAYSYYLIIFARGIEASQSNKDSDETFNILNVAKRIRICSLSNPDNCAHLQILEGK